MKLTIATVALAAALPAFAQDAPTPDDALIEMMIRQLGPDAPADMLALPGEVQATSRAEGAPEERASGLREGFAAAAIEGAELTSVACDGPRCTVEIALAAEDPAALTAGLLAFEDWIAGSSPCPYAITSDPGAAPRVRAAINCEG